MWPGFSETIFDTLAVYADGRIMSLMQIICKTEVNKDSGQDLVVLQSNIMFIVIVYVDYAFMYKYMNAYIYYPTYIHVNLGY